MSSPSKQNAAKVKGLAHAKFDGTGMKIAIITTRWNEKIIEALSKGCKEELIASNVAEEDILMYSIPGAFELPFAAKKIIEANKVDAVVCIGCLIKGDTMHFEYICESVSHGIMRLGLDTGIPVIFGVLTCLTEQQALARAGLIPGVAHNHGPEWGTAAIDMALLSRNAGRSSSGPSPKRKKAA